MDAIGGYFYSKVNSLRVCGYANELVTLTTKVVDSAHLERVAAPRKHAGGQPCHGSTSGTPGP
jgi:hypothetical protein